MKNQNETVTKSARIANARALVGELYPWGGQWKFNYWPDGLDKLGRESLPQNYHAARVARSQTLVNIANGPDDAAQYDGGDWTQYVL